MRAGWRGRLLAIDDGVSGTIGATRIGLAMNWLVNGVESVAVEGEGLRYPFWFDFKHGLCVSKELKWVIRRG